MMYVAVFIFSTIMPWIADHCNTGLHGMYSVRISLHRDISISDVCFVGDGSKDICKLIDFDHAPDSGHLGLSIGLGQCRSWHVKSWIRARMDMCTDCTTTSSLFCTCVYGMHSTIHSRTFPETDNHSMGGDLVREDMQAAWKEKTARPSN